MGFTQIEVARLLGFPDTSMISRYETGQSLPPLAKALELGIVLRVPVEFLFPAMYEASKYRIREQEEQLARPVQAVLPLGGMV